jgi:hypothetical protein
MTPERMENLRTLTERLEKIVGALEDQKAKGAAAGK